MKKFAIIDVETTGGSPGQSKITEIAIYIHDGEKIIDEFASLVNPEMEIPKFVMHLTGISQEMVATAPKFHEIAKKVVEITADCVFVAHNVNFDYSMIRHEFKSLGYDYRRPQLCTVRTSRQLLPGHESYSLGKLARALSIQVDGRHRAGGDALATAKIFSLLYANANHDLSAYIHEEININHIHPKLSLDTFDLLPEKVGLYFFYDETNQLIYVGRSKNIKKRVEQHFRVTSAKKGAEMRKEIARIEVELTGSELIASLIEASLIKDKNPKYNPRSSKKKFSYGLYSYFDQRGYLNLCLDKLKNKQNQPLAKFISSVEAEKTLHVITDKFTLCQKLNGLYPSKSSCFRRQTKECLGACVGEENETQYNERVHKALNQLSFNEPDFFIVDKGRNRTEKSIILIENNTYVGYAFLHFTELKRTAKHWKTLIDRQVENEELTYLVQQYVGKTDELKIRSLKMNI